MQGFSGKTNLKSGRENQCLPDSYRKMPSNSNLQLTRPKTQNTPHHASCKRTVRGVRSVMRLSSDTRSRRLNPRGQRHILRCRWYWTAVCPAPDRPAELLRGFPCSLVNDGFVGVLKDFPILFGSLLAVLVPVTGLEIDGMPHIFHTGENVAHCRTPPAVGIFKLVVPAVAHALCGKVGRRSNCKSRYHFRVLFALCAPFKERVVLRYG